MCLFPILFVILQCMKKFFAMTLGALQLVCCAPEQIDQAEWHSVDPKDFTTQPVDLFDNRWMALTVGNQTSANSMTISWGSLGVLWNKPIVIVYVSEDRFTKHLMDGNEYFTVTGFPQSEECRAALGYLGSASGRNEDKMAGSGLTVKYTELGNPYFDEGNIAIECKKIYSDAFKMDLLPAEEREGRYSRMGIHTFYIGEIVNIWEK